jgi:hypothetical protein
MPVGVVGYSEAIFLPGTSSDGKSASRNRVTNRCVKCWRHRRDTTQLDTSPFSKIGKWYR